MPWCDVVPGLVVTGVVAGGVVVAGVVVVGVAVSDEDGLDAAPLDEPLVPVLAADGDELVVLVPDVAADDVGVVEVELVGFAFVTLAASNGSRVRLVGAVRCPEDVWGWLAGDDVVDVPLAAGGGAMSALARWPCSRKGTATIAAMIKTASGQSRRSMRSRFRDFILWPPWFRRPSSRPSVDR